MTHAMLRIVAAALAGAAVYVGATAAPAERPAVPARLTGYCGGQAMAAVEESAFPAGCASIETITKESN